MRLNAGSCRVPYRQHMPVQGTALRGGTTHLPPNVLPRNIHPRWSTPSPPLPEDTCRRAPRMRSSQARRRGVDEASGARGQSGGRGTTLHSPWTAGQKMPRSMVFLTRSSRLSRMWARRGFFRGFFRPRRGFGRGFAPERRPEKRREKRRGFGRGFAVDLPWIFPSAPWIFPLVCF